MIASLLAVGASPASAVPENADNTADTAACAGDAIADNMFSDVSDDHAFGDAINCVAYYGITNGTGDGSTYSPNQDVTRAQMAVFIARSAGVAGVDVGSGSGGFSDIGDTWQEAQDAINGLASSGMIPKGGDFRPDDSITRAEMATFLIGLLAKAAGNVTIDSSGAIQLGTGGSTDVADDWFADARASQPRARDAEISALYELGVTKGRGAAAVQDDSKSPLDTNYEPAGTVNRGAMAEFITRALAHTSVRPEGVSAQYDGTDVVVSVRDKDFQPMSNVVVDVFRTDTSGVDLAFRGNGSCGEVTRLAPDSDVGYLCEIDGTDMITGGDGDARDALVGGVNDGGTRVWAWTGDSEDTVDDDTDLYVLDISKSEEKAKAAQASVSTEFGGMKQKLGSSVLYTLQLQDGDGGDVTVGTDTKKPASYLASLSTFAYNAQLGDFLSNASIVTPIPLTTDSDGKATVTVAAPSADLDETRKGDKYRVVLTVIVIPDSGHNAPAGDLDDDVRTPDAAVLVDGDGATWANATMVFSTEPGVVDAADITVSVEPAAGFVVADDRGAGNRATVSVTNQYGDPITGVKVTLSSSEADTGGDEITGSSPTRYELGGGREFTVGRDGSYTFGYERESDAAATETLTANLVGYDHDGDGSAADLEDDDQTAEDESATAPLTQTGEKLVEWAGTPAASGDDATDKLIRAFDTETNTIFVDTDDADTAGGVVVLGYDSNDRFNTDVDGTDSDAEPTKASSYTAFEKALAKGKRLSWTINSSGSRAVNVFTLTPAAS